ncbi:MAG: tetratricopeptide repeat protein [Gammaproteobacteria bacterium]
MTASCSEPRWHIHLCAALASLALGGMPCLAAAASVPAAPDRPYQAQDWDLAWRAFVDAGAVDDAYALAKSAVKARPGSRRWLVRLAQSARWSGHPRVALTALSRLALDLHQTRYLQPALDLATGLGENARTVALLRELIRLGRATPAQQRMLTGLYLDIGDPQQAIRELQREFERHPSPKLLWEQVVIYRTLGDPKHELATLQRYRKRFGPGPKVMLAIATQHYVQGRLQQALDALLAAESRARPSDTEYWKTLSGLAWPLGRYRLAARAARVLVDTGKADAATYQRLVYVEQYRHPKRAFAVAEQGWKRTHEPALFLAMLSIASSLRPATPWLARAYAQLDDGHAAAFADNPAYWTSLAALRAGQGRNGEARAAYRHALRLSPGDDGLLAGYLWLLVDTGDLTPLAPEVYRLDRRARQAPELWAPLAAVYAALDQPQRALPWLQRQWPGRRGDPLWLLVYADTLEQADHPHAAWRVRRRAYDLLAHRAAQPADPRQVDRRLRALARLATSLAPGDPARRAIEGLARRPRSQEARVTVLAWMQDEGAYPLARWWRLRAFLRRPPPAWAQLARALAENDGPAIARLLERRRGHLPRRDRVNAATTLGWDSLGLSLAYRGLQGEPDDARLQDQFNGLALPRADTLGAAAAATRTSGLLAEGVTLRAGRWLSPRNRLDARLDVVHQRSVDSAQLGTPPSLRRSLLLAWRHVIGPDRLTVDLGAGRSLASWTRAGIAWHRRWTSRLETTVGATAGARPRDTAALGVAGLEDRLNAEAGAQLTPRTNLQLQLEAGRLRAQGGGKLGAVQRFSFAADHRLWLSPPDLTLHASLSGAHYNRAARLPDRLASLVPAGQTPAVDFFVPASFVQACGGGHFNLQYETTYTARLRPYAGVDLCANSVSGQGYDLTAGIAMPVLGPDHLSLSLNLQSNLGTRSGRTTAVMLRYRHYFTPTQ